MTEKVNEKEEILTELEYVFLRLSSAANKEQLETFVNKNLSILFTHLSNGDEDVRSKAIEIFTTFHRRLKNNAEVSLPVETLLSFYESDDCSSFVKNFALLYLKIGYPRLQVVHQLELLPRLLTVSCKKPKPEQIRLFSLLVPALNKLSSNMSNEEYKNKLTFTSDYSNLAKFFDFLGQILQLPYSTPSSGRFRCVNRDKGFASEAMDVDSDDDHSAGHGASNTAGSQFNPSHVPGLSKFVYTNLMSDSCTIAFKTNPNFLEQVKIGIVKLLSKLEPKLSNKTNWLLILASADTMHTVVDNAEAQIKKVEDYEDKESMENLFVTFLGNEKSKDVTAEDRKSAAALRVKLKILTFFLRSATASKFFPQNIQIVFEGLFGSGNNLKLMQMAVNFGLVVSANLSGKSAMVFGPLLMNAAQRLVDEYDDEKLLCAGYRLMGNLGKVCSTTIVKNVGKIQHLFEKISTESDDVSSAVQDCLVAWSDFFIDQADASTKKILEALILAYIENKSAKCRLTALKYLEKFCSAENIESRFALFLACGDSDEHVRKEALRILQIVDVSHDSKTSSISYPSFDTTVQFCCQRVNLKRNSSTNNSIPFKIESMKQMVNYLIMSLKQSVGEQKLKTYVDSCVKERGGVLENCSIFNYFQLLCDLVDNYSINELIFLTALRDLVISCGDCFVKYMKGKMEFLENLAGTVTRPDACVVICDLYSFCLVGTLESDELFIDKFRNLMTTADQTNELVLGRCLLLAFLAFYSKSNVRTKYELDFRNAQEFFIKRLNEGEKSVTNLFAACFSLMIILKTAPVVTDDEQTLNLIKFLLGLVQSRKDNVKIKLKERAVGVLAWICVGRKDSMFLEPVVEGLIKIGEVPSDIELQIVVGEAFTICCGCSVSSSYSRSPDTVVLSVDEDLATERLKYLLDKLINDVAKMENRHVKNALGHWLYILLEHFNLTEIVGDRLIAIQTVLLDCLAENNEFTQDTACRALAYVFQVAKENQKDGLIYSLLEKLNSPNAKETLLPYQELCSLATFIGNRQTIYAFMQLAVQRQKSTVRNLKLVKNESYEILEKYFNKVVPFLYRATYDPSPKVQSTMKLIWSSLQTENGKSLVQPYALEILNYLVDNLTNKNWRVRESCCLALSDFLTSTSGDLAANHLSDLWQVLFRVCDDIKESVRIAASKCILTLHRVTVKFCCPEPGVVKSKALDAVLPILLSALESNVKEVNALSLLTLTALSKEAGSKLKPHLPLLIAALLDSLSTMEPQAVNYFAVRASGQEAEAIDQARVAASKSSPMMDAVEYCVRFVDKDVFNELVPKICSILQSSIGLATKTGCCRLVNLLCVQCPVEIKSHADKLLKSLTTHGLSDRNSTVRKHASVSIGHLVKYCSDSALNQLFTKIEPWYLDAESGKHSSATCAFLLRAIANENADQLKPYGSLLVPVVYMAITDTSSNSETASDLKQTWQEVWNELTNGTDLAMKLYADDILNFCLRLFQTSPNWDVKVRALQTLSSIAEKYCTSINDEKLVVLVNTLFEALQGRIWTGKEKILSTLSSIFEQSGTRLNSLFSSQSKSEMYSTLMKDCKKTNVPYRTAAVRCVGEFCKHLQFSDGFVTLLPLLEPFLNKEKKLYDSDDEIVPSSFSKVSGAKFDESNEFFACSYKSLTQSLSVVESGEHLDAVRSFAALCLRQLNICFWKVQLQILDALYNLLENHQEYVDLKILTLDVILTYENAAQNSVKDACVVVLRVCCTVLLSANEKVDVNKLKLISSDSYCREFYPDLVSLINLLIQ